MRRLLAAYRRLPETARMVLTAILGALIGLATYELIFALMPLEPRATLSWALGFVVGVARQHALHRWLTFHGRRAPYLASLARAYLMYSASLVAGATLDWLLTTQLHLHHRLAWLACLVFTASLSFLFLRRFVFAEPASPAEPTPPHNPVP